jgi:N-acetylmuramoyl-L-alanine amidase
MKKKFLLLVFIGMALISFTILLIEVPGLPTENAPASLFFKERVIPEALHNRYEDGRLRILVVPGHDDSSPGAVYRGLKEADVNLTLSYYLASYLKKDKNIRVSILRKRNGSYSDWFNAFKEEERSAIIQFRDRVRGVMKYALGSKKVEKHVPHISHNPAADNVSLDLYGINKYANENWIDIVLHMHFNDYPRARRGVPGKYSGFAMYVPEEEFPNARASREVADAIKEELEKYIPASDLPGEKETIIETQDLIAVGSNASRNGVSLLVEYGYIYEPYLQDSVSREMMLKELAHLTYNGLANFLNSQTPPRKYETDTTVLPYGWGPTLRKGDRGADVLALQFALNKEGLYPPRGFSLSECPISSYYGSCTARAVRAFQEKYASGVLAPLGLQNGTGMVGARTIYKLNELYAR